MAKIIWIASYPKSGNTWVRSFVFNLLNPSERPGLIADLPTFFQGEIKRRWYEPYARGRPLESLSADEIFAMRRQVHVDIAQSSPAVVFAKTHSPYGSYNQFPLQNPAVMAGAVYVVRNPLDVVLSVADHFGRSIDDAIDFMAEQNNATPTDDSNVMDFLGSWSINVATWAAHKDHPQMTLVRYEDLLDKPTKSFRNIARLLGRGDDELAIKRAVKFSSFGELRKQETEHAFSERSPHSERFFRKGTRDQWKQVLSDDQIGRIVDEHYEQMSRFNYVPSRFRQ